MSYTDDPSYDYDNYCRDREEQLQKYPECGICGERIQDDFCYVIDGVTYCEECLKDEFRVLTEDLMED